MYQMDFINMPLRIHQYAFFICFTFIGMSKMSAGC